MCVCMCMFSNVCLCSGVPVCFSACVCVCVSTFLQIVIWMIFSPSSKNHSYTHTNLHTSHITYDVSSGWHCRLCTLWAACEVCVVPLGSKQNTSPGSVVRTPAEPSGEAVILIWPCYYVWYLQRTPQIKKTIIDVPFSPTGPGGWGSSVGSCSLQPNPSIEKNVPSQTEKRLQIVGTLVAITTSKQKGKIATEQIPGTVKLIELTRRSEQCFLWVRVWLGKKSNWKQPYWAPLINEIEFCTLSVRGEIRRISSSV